MVLEQDAIPPIDAFPFLRYVPEFMCQWRTKAKAIQEEQQFLLLNVTKEPIAKGKNKDCFMANVLARQDDEWDEEHMAYFGGVLVRFYRES